MLGALLYDKKKHAVVSVLGDSISHGSCSEEGGAEGAAAWGQTLSEDGPLQEDCDPELWFGCISDFGTLITVSVLRYNSKQHSLTLESHHGTCCSQKCCSAELTAR